METYELEEKNGCSSCHFQNSKWLGMSGVDGEGTRLAYRCDRCGDESADILLGVDDILPPKLAWVRQPDGNIKWYPVTKENRMPRNYDDDIFDTVRQEVLKEHPFLPEGTSSAELDCWEKEYEELVEEEVTGMDYGLVVWLTAKMEWSYRTFGTAERHNGVLKHIEKEIEEVRQNPQDVTEWVDIILLAFDGACRMGHTPKQVVDALIAKQKQNMARKWGPPQPDDQPCFHLKD